MSDWKLQTRTKIMQHSIKQVSFVQGWIILIMIILSFGGHRSHGLKKEAQNCEKVGYSCQYGLLSQLFYFTRIMLKQIGWYFPSWNPEIVSESNRNIHNVMNALWSMCRVKTYLFINIKKC